MLRSVKDDSRWIDAPTPSAPRAHTVQRDLGDRIAARASATRKSLSVGGLALLALACCVGLPLVAAAGLSAAALTWLGGIAAGAVALAVLAAILITRAGRRARGTASCNHRRPDLTKGDRK